MGPEWIVLAERDHPLCLRQVEVLPSGLGDSAGPHEGQGKELQAVPRRVGAALARVVVDLAQQFAELRLIGDGRALLLAMLCRARVEVYI